MKVNYLQNSISCVVLGKFEPTMLSLDWLKKTTILPSDLDGKTEILFQAISKFRAGVFEFICQQDRIQISTSDKSRSLQMYDIVSNILKALPDVQVSAVGINGEIQFSFQTLKDSYLFGKYFMNLDAFNETADKPLVRSFTIEGKLKLSGNMEAKRSYMISSIPAELNTSDIPVVSVSVNNHFPVQNSAEAIAALGLISALHNVFFEDAEKIIKRV